MRARISAQRDASGLLVSIVRNVLFAKSTSACHAVISGDSKSPKMARALIRDAWNRKYLSPG